MKMATLLLFSVMSAEQSLRTAKGELEHAGGEWGGHRVQHIDAALHELEQAEQWARQHHDIK